MMFASQVKQTIIGRHQGNMMLSAPFLSPVQQNARDLSVDQPSTPLDAAIIEATIKALAEGQTHYVEVPGIAPLREALVEYLRELGIDHYAQATLAVTASIQESRFLSVQVIGESSEPIAIPEAVHPGVRKAIGLRPKEVLTLPINGAAGMLPTLEGIRNALAGGCKIIYLESPVRLTGACFKEAAVCEIADMLTEANAYAIWDQGMCPWLEDGAYASLGAAENMPERVTLIGEAFPGVGLEGWGVGYLATGDAWFAGISKLKQVMAICTSTPSQFAALEASKSYDATRGKLLEQMSEVRRAAVAAVKKIGLDIVAGKTANILTLRPASTNDVKRALSGAGYGYADGATFGVPGVIRLSVTPEGLLNEALKQIR